MKNQNLSRQEQQLSREQKARQKIVLALLDAGVVFLDSAVFVGLVNRLWGLVEEFGIANENPPR